MCYDFKVYVELLRVVEGCPCADGICRQQLKPRARPPDPTDGPRDLPARTIRLLYRWTEEREFFFKNIGFPLDPSLRYSRNLRGKKWNIY
ncbi:hypothetical protein J6590_070006 [Homalodisca vitripennis]|nr:hypothetical protein J6590_070006 [Homalodisca vitripennis]